jgi:hypothetical protein
MGRKQRPCWVEGKAAARQGRDGSDWAEEETKRRHIEEETAAARVAEAAPWCRIP